MILADTTRRSVQLALAGPALTQLPFVATCLDRDQQSGRLLSVLTMTGTTSDTTPVTPVPAPSSAVSRKLQTLVVQNADGFAAQVSLGLNDSVAGTTNAYVVTLQPGDHLHYVDGAQLKVMDKNGNTKNVFTSVTTVAALFSAGRDITLTNLGATLRIDAGEVPAGMMAVWAGTGSPSGGWLPCDGASYSTVAYPDLFGAIGYNYGGSGVNFNVPNLVGHTI